MSGDAEQVTSAPPELLNKALQDAYEAGYEQGIKDAQGQLQQLLESCNNNMPVVELVGRHQNWPTMKNQLLSFNGKELSFSKKYSVLVQALLAAKGAVLSQDELEVLYGKKSAIHPAIYNIRKVLEEGLPEIEIETIGSGYRMVIKD